MIRPDAPSPPELLDQRSAQSWALIEVRSLILLIVGVLIGGPTIYVNAGTPLGSAAAVITVILGLGAVGVDWFAEYQGGQAAARERQAGYTTLAKGGNDLWTLDHRTGMPTRPPDRIDG